MVYLSTLALAASSLFALSTAAPLDARQTWIPGTQNNTQEFNIRMSIVEGQTTYNNYILQTYHTGAGLADPVFVPPNSPSSSLARAFLNGTQLQFDNSPYPFGANGFPGDSNYARWEPVTCTSGYGSGTWVFKAVTDPRGEQGLELVIDTEEWDGWLVCEWYHGYDMPQLFELVTGFDKGGGFGPDNFPVTCARARLFADYF